MNLIKDSYHFFTESKRRNPLLYYLGLGMGIQFLFFLIAFQLCKDQIDGICHWLKPFKFTLSFSLYALTLGWFMYYLKERIGPSRIRMLSWVITIAILIDMTAMLLTSWLFSDHYASLGLSPASRELLRKTFSVVGNLCILTNLTIAIYIGYQFFQIHNLKPLSYLWGIRIGFIVFIVSCFLGEYLFLFYKSEPLNSTHLGFPFWQMRSFKDSLVSLHFVGIHYLQLLPLAGFYFKEHLGKLFAISAGTMYASALTYAIFLAP